MVVDLLGGCVESSLFYSSCNEQGLALLSLQSVGFSLKWLLLQSMGSRACRLSVRAPVLWCTGSLLRLPGSGAQAQCSGSRALEHGLSSCGSRALEHGLSSYSSRALEHGLSVAAPGLWSTGSVVVAHRLCCSLACGILLGKVLNPCLLCWQMNSLSLSHQGSSWLLDFIKCFFCVF